MLDVPVVEAVPLQTDDHGIIRIAKTRVTLDTVIGSFNDGASAEEIVHRYPALSLADVYSVIGYYLRHKGELDEYLHKRAAREEEVIAEIRARNDIAGIRQRLLARLDQKKG